jgi:hypothetical protein
VQTEGNREEDVVENIWTSVDESKRRIKKIS